MPGVEIEMIGFDGDHLHMVIIIPLKYRISDVMGRLKSQSSSVMHKKFKWLSKVNWKENIMWWPGCFISNMGIDEETIKRYFECQGRKDSVMRDARRNHRTTGLPVGIHMQCDRLS